MNDTTTVPEPAFHLFLDAEEVPVAAGAIRLLISDEAHQPRIRELAREVLAGLEGTPDEEGRLTVALEAEQLKVIHSAVGLLFDDLQREQAAEREILRGILNKLPDKHSIRAVEIE